MKKAYEQIHTELMNIVKDEIDFLYSAYDPDAYDSIIFNLYDRFEKFIDKNYIE